MPTAEEATHIATSFMDQFFRGEDPNLGDVDTLCSLCCTQEGNTSQSALQALYGIIIEGLSNDFSQHGMELGNRVLVRMITYVRSLPEGQDLHLLLNDLGLADAESILHRFNTLLNSPPLSKEEHQNIKKILLPSRVTVGADVVMASVLVQRLTKTFKNAEVVMMGPAHIPQLFDGFPRLTHRLVEHNRHGNLSDRITGWVQFHQMVQQEISLCNPKETLFVDPDSRLTQLGLLPLLPDDRTRFFPSRYLCDTEEVASLVTKTNQWYDRQFDESPKVWPHVAIDAADCKAALGFKKRLKAPFFLVINLGVGNNESKRLSDHFEKELLLSLLAMEDVVILLDSGTQDSGLRKVKNYLEICHEKGYKTDFLYEQEIEQKEVPFSHGIVGFRGSIGRLGSFISVADGFFGYDSCCQHIASASDRPAVITFVGAANDRFYSRWCSQGEQNRTHTIRLDDGKKYSTVELCKIIERIVSEFQTIRRQKG